MLSVSLFYSHTYLEVCMKFLKGGLLGRLYIYLILIFVVTNTLAPAPQQRHSVLFVPLFSKLIQAQHYSSTSTPLQTPATAAHCSLIFVEIHHIIIIKKETRTFLSSVRITFSGAFQTFACPPKLQLVVPPGFASHIHNAPLHARWLSSQVFFLINQTAFELINNKSISRRREIRVSWGHCLFVRQTSAALSLSAMELGASFTLKSCGYLAIINLTINYK